MLRNVIIDLKSRNRGFPWNLSTQRGREEAGKTDQDSSDQGVPERVMVHD
jgi:hypothetical protein